MAKEDQIPFIYNWCDRWCEKCPFIDRCAIGSLEREFGESDPSNVVAFNRRLKAIFEAAEDRLNEIAADMGIFFDDMSPEEEAEIEAEIELIDLMTESHPLTSLCDQYTSAVNKWFEKDAVKSIVAEHEEALDFADHPRLDMGTALTMKECIHVIHWYKYFIPAKCRRMLSEEQEGDWEEEPSESRPYNGTAKITLIAVERSIAAWFSISELLNGYHSEVNSFMIQLKQIHKMIEEVFPNARDFIRPGFDEHEKR